MLCQFNINVLPEEHGVIIMIIAIIIIIIAHICIGLSGAQSISTIAVLLGPPNCSVSQASRFVIIGAPFDW